MPYIPVSPICMAATHVDGRSADDCNSVGYPEGREARGPSRAVSEANQGRYRRRSCGRHGSGRSTQYDGQTSRSSRASASINESWTGPGRRRVSERSPRNRCDHMDYLEKSAGRLSKEWTLTSPIPTGIVPYDLEAPWKNIWPRPTPLSNSSRVSAVRVRSAATRCCQASQDLGLVA